LIHKWFNEPHVQKFYSLRNWSEQEVLDKLQPTIDSTKAISAFIIFYNDNPIGYIQCYKVSDFPWPMQDLSDEQSHQGAGLDLFIGDPYYVGKGLGKNLLNQFLIEKIWPHFKYCVVDPDERNTTSKQLFEKCGFKLHKKIPYKDALGKPVTLCLMIKTNEEF